MFPLAAPGRATAPLPAVTARLSVSRWILPGMTKREVGEAIQTAMWERGLTFTELAVEMGRPRVWVAAAVMGQHPFSHEEAEKLGATLDLPAEAVPVLEQIPTRGALDATVPVDPTIYRLYEVIQV